MVIEIWDNFLGEALKEGTSVPAPEAEVVGFQYIKPAIELGKKKVCAKKLVALLRALGLVSPPAGVH